MGNNGWKEEWMGWVMEGGRVNSIEKEREKRTGSKRVRM